MRVVAERLQFVEDRLERLLAAGSNNGEVDVTVLHDAASSLEPLGLDALAIRLRAVVAASPLERLDQAAAAWSACHLLRVRLEDDGAPRGQWEPLTPGRTDTARNAGRPAPRSRARTARLMPIGRMIVGDREAWACIRLAFPRLEFFLVDPLPTESSPWLTRIVRGHSRWLARYPLGTAGDVSLIALGQAEWEVVGPEVQECGGVDRKMTWNAENPGTVGDGFPILGYSNHLQLKQLDASDAESCAWPDPSTQAAFLSAVDGTVLTIAWVDGSLVTPLAIIVPFSERPERLIHLTTGNPVDALES